MTSLLDNTRAFSYNSLYTYFKYLQPFFFFPMIIFDSAHGRFITAGYICQQVSADNLAKARMCAGVGHNLPCRSKLRND